MIDPHALGFDRAAWYRDQIVHIAEHPAREAESANIALHPVLQAHLERLGIRLYRHQIEAIEALRAGRNVILSTPTASGKTLAFNLPVLEAMLSDLSSTALYLYPLKALANDQLKKLTDIESSCGLHISPRTYDGDTPAAQRNAIKRNARIILTNPYALHQYLPWHHQWERVFSHLDTLVVDEAHYYRGLFGANVAHLLRRLLRIAEYYGSRPRIVLSSASIANPDSFGRALTGRDMVSISESGAEQGERSVLFWDTQQDPGRSVSRQAAHLLRHLTSRGIRTLCFVRSRPMAEVVARTAQRLGAADVRSYRAGYLPEQRRDIEADLRSGALSGVVSTSALEAGIDIGGLDAAILVGFPGSLLSAWQQAGRAGRRGAPSLIVYMPYEDPLDRYFLHHPDEYMSKTREHLVIPLDNPHQRAGHLACAAAELPLRDKELEEPDRPLVHSLAEAGILARTPHGLVYQGLQRAHDVLRFGDLGTETVRLVCDGETIETLDRLRACRTAFPGAVLLHRGETLVVDRLDLENRVAGAHREDVDIRTHSLRSSEIEVLGVDAQRTAGGLGLARGRVRVTESFRGYKAIHADRTIDVHPLDLPDYTFETDATWITWRTDPPVSPGLLMGALHGAEHALIAMAPVLVLSDPDDIGGISTPFHPQTHAPTILIHDSTAGGSGIAEALYAKLPDLAQRAYGLVSGCPCTEGCPSCLLSPRCGSQNQPLSKLGAQEILRHVADDLAE